MRTAAIALAACCGTLTVAAVAAAQPRVERWVVVENPDGTVELEPVVAAATPPVARVDTAAPEPARRPGSFFLVEAYGGATVVGGFGGSGTFLAGVGGKPVGFPWRFFLIGELGYSTAATEGIEPGLGVSYGDTRSWFDMAAGLRVLIPLVEPLRVHLDVLGGGSLGSARLEREGLRSLAVSEWNPLAVFAAGVQIRVLEELSVGVQVALRLTGDPLSDLRDTLGIGTFRPMTLGAGVTWHL